MVKILFCISFVVGSLSSGAEPAGLKRNSALYTPERLAQIRTNVNQLPWAAGLRDQVVVACRPWMELSDTELWQLMFGHTISRSWMVWSDGHCPACKKSVDMYRWKMEAWKHPWKVRCPNCEELFPKNDFYAFYQSGLNEQGVFDPKKANRQLLFNAEHPDPNDPLHRFGVDDGEGYVEENKRWRFIGAYLIFGQFHQRIQAGIKKMAAAYVLTGEMRYAHKAAVLLDRVADLYPTFDFAKQGFVYEKPNHNGYISVWHDACEETYDLTLAYDQIFEGIRQDESLIAFLSSQAARYKLSNAKTSFTDIQRNIEGGILRDALAHMEKIHSNFPRRECTVSMIHTVLGWPENRAEVETMIDSFVKQATAVDGVTGEKGLGGYTAYTIAAMARFLGEYVRADDVFLRQLLNRNPGLRQTYRFHIDTHCLNKYYPLIGDTGTFGQPMPKYAIASHYTFRPPVESPLAPSLFTFLWQLHRETGDPAYAQIAYRENDRSVTNLPYDLFAAKPGTVQQELQQLIDRHGEEPKLGSLDKKQWHLAILRSGKNENARAAWLDYDAGGAHGHADGLNLGLFAHGLDLLPDFGYPPVQFGGWYTDRANWYKMSAAHNTVVVDGGNHFDGAGQTTLWADGKFFRATRASAPSLIKGKQFERTVSLIDVSETNFYLVDIFRVMGGSDHARFVHSFAGQIQTQGLDRDAASTNLVEFGNKTQTRGFQVYPKPASDWSVTWNFEDRFKVLPKDKRVSMRYTDLTTGAEAMVGEAWIVGGYFTGKSDELWNPCILTRRRGTAPLASTFVAVIEPFSGSNSIVQVRRLALTTPGGESFGDANVAIELRFEDGSRDLLVAADVENLAGIAPSLQSTGTLVQTNWEVRLAGELAWVRKNSKNELTRVALARARSLQVGRENFIGGDDGRLVEFRIEAGKRVMESGPER